MNENKFNKGQYEKAAERAKELLDKGIGITEIINMTGLSEERINKIHNKMKR
ncbi:hypothetical protein KQI89_03830 [Clostridium sp. MSJ-4]|uniref:Transposase n=1 Tax=Clostridium simiarum TaxID=2841506 RepID=A0ABS6EXC6_9CLOT|nr:MULTISPECIES: hypothetical protein [Clostridium]MBU5590884.1 hypothetical protein [Clostridium simiarum]